MTADIRYASNYGSTRRYAEELAARSGAAAHPLNVPLRPGRHPVVVLSPVMGPRVQAATFVAAQDVAGRPFAAVAVGMTLPEVARDTDVLARLLGESAAAVERFYLPGRLYYSELKATHRVLMWAVTQAARRKRNRTENDRQLIAAHGKDTDRVDLSELDPIVEWVRAQR